MKTPTIKDIAREAGVSHGTVSNVLNGRGNVSVEKIQLVTQAADRLGYRLNAKAQVLRQGKQDAVMLIIPSTRFPAYADFYEAFQRELHAFGYTVQLFCTNSLSAEEEAAIDLALMSRMAAIVAVISSESERLQMAARTMPVILLDNQVATCPGVLPAGFDHQEAGRLVAQELNRRRARQVGVFTGDGNASHIRYFLAGFRSAFSGGADYFDSTDQLAEIKAFSLFEEGRIYDYIVCTDELRGQAVIQAHSLSSREALPRLATLSSRRAIAQSGCLSCQLDYKGLARLVAAALFGGEKQALILPPSGFRHSQPERKQTGGELRFLTVSSPSSVALSRLLPHFEQQSGIRVELTVVGLEQLYDLAHNVGEDSRFDLVRMDMAWITELAPQVYRPLSDLPFDWEGIIGKILPFFLQDYTTTRQIRYCLPYDPSSQIFFYRKDLFEDPTIKRMYYEMYRQELTLPETFDGYNQAARFFTREFNPRSPVPYGTTTAIGSSVVSPSEYMPRLFGEGGSFFDRDGRIALVTPEAKAALENYVESYRYSDKTVYEWWKGALESFSGGLAAMTIVFMNYASDIVNTSGGGIAGKIGYATVPGHKPLIGGGVVGISRGSQNEEAAFRFLQWLYSDEIAPVFTMLGGLSPCRTAYEDQDVLKLYPWLSAAKDSFPIGQRRLQGGHYRNFSEKKLEEIISAQVKNAVLGIVTPQEALLHAQEECRSYFIPLR